MTGVAVVRRFARIARSTSSPSMSCSRRLRSITFGGAPHRSSHANASAPERCSLTVIVFVSGRVLMTARAAASELSITRTSAVAPSRARDGFIALSLRRPRLRHFSRSGSDFCSSRALQPTLDQAALVIDVIPEQFGRLRQRNPQAALRTPDPAMKRHSTPFDIGLVFHFWANVTREMFRRLSKQSYRTWSPNPAPRWLLSRTDSLVAWTRVNKNFLGEKIHAAHKRCRFSDVCGNAIHQRHLL